MSAHTPDQPQSLKGDHSVSGLRCALVVSEFNPLVTHGLLEQALLTLEAQGMDRRELTVVWVPGAFELPLVAKRLAVTGRFEVIICLGAIIRGETAHYDLICDTTARGISQASLETGIPIIFGVVTTETVDQALERSTPGSLNRGRAAALAAIEMATLIRQLKT